jgi:hypothetical protein
MCVLKDDLLNNIFQNIHACGAVIGSGAYRSFDPYIAGSYSAVGRGDHSFGWDHINRDASSVASRTFTAKRHELSKYGSKFATLSPITVTVAGYLKNCSGWYKKNQIIQNSMLNLNMSIANFTSLLLNTNLTYLVDIKIVNDCVKTSVEII